MHSPKPSWCDEGKVLPLLLFYHTACTFVFIFLLLSSFFIFRFLVSCLSSYVLVPYFSSLLLILSFFYVLLCLYSSFLFFLFIYLQLFPSVFYFLPQYLFFNFMILFTTSPFYCSFFSLTMPISAIGPLSSVYVSIN